MTDDIKLSIAVIIGTFLILGGVVVVVRLLDSTSTVDVGQITGSREHIKGNPEANNTIVEFSDFLCPACALSVEVVDGLIEEYGEQVNFEYRHFILPQHANSLDAAYAVEAAGKQGKYWETHDWLFEHQTRWEEAAVSKEYFFGEFGEGLGLNQEQFFRDYDSEAVHQKVADDNAAANGLGLSSTPTFFINGQKEVGLLEEDDFLAQLDLTGGNNDGEVAPTEIPSDEGEPTIEESTDDTDHSGAE